MPTPEPLPVPATPDQLTPDWLTSALRGSGHLPHGTVRSVSATTIGSGHGFTGVVTRLRPAYYGLAAGPPPPATMVAKLPTAEPPVPSGHRTRQRADPAAADRFYQRCAREVRFYRELAGAVGTGAPRCYHAAADPDRHRVVLLLEDLTGGRVGDALAGSTPEQAGATLDTVAGLHARWWRQPPPGWVPRLITDPAAGQIWFADRAARFLAQHADRVPPPVRDLVDTLRGSFGEVLAELARAPATVLHADLHPDNAVFDPPGRPVAILDWQTVSYGPAVVDVAEALFASLPVPDRRAHQDRLLERYVATLAGHGVAGYPVDRLRRDLRLVLPRLLAGRVAWLAGTDPESLSGRERALVEAAFGDGRLVAALQDHHLI